MADEKSVNGLAQLEERIAGFGREADAALGDIEIALERKKNAEVCAGELLLQIREQALYRERGFDFMTDYLRDGEARGLWKYSSARRWMKAAPVVERTGLLESESTKAAMVGSLDPELQLLVAPIVAGTDWSAKNSLALIKAIRDLPVERRGALSEFLMQVDDTDEGDSEDYGEEERRVAELVPDLSEVAALLARGRAQSSAAGTPAPPRPEAEAARFRLLLLTSMSTFVNTAPAHARGLLAQGVALSDADRERLLQRLDEVAAAHKDVRTQLLRSSQG